MISAVTKTRKRCPSLDISAKQMTAIQLKKVFERYNDYLNALCNEDGHVNEYERVCDRLTPYLEEYEKRGKNE